MQRSDVMDELLVDFAFTESEAEDLTTVLKSLNRNPYVDYQGFAAQVADVVTDGLVPSRFLDACRTEAVREHSSAPFFSCRNCPVDDELLIWNSEDPVAEKRRLKKTYVAEGFLEVVALATNRPIISYANVNEGDRFQDIYPKKGMENTQSQKAIVPILFHKDLANHFVRPDFVHMLCLRASTQNETWTTFVSNAEALKLLNNDCISVLRESSFYTPFDDLTVRGEVSVGRAANHPVLSGQLDLRYFEGRTVATTPGAANALNSLNQALHQAKHRVLMLPGDFVSLHNNFSVHSKEVHAIRDQGALRHRWIMKTTNVVDLDQYSTHFLPRRYGVVNG